MYVYVHRYVYLHAHISIDHLKTVSLAVHQKAKQTGNAIGWGSNKKFYSTKGDGEADYFSETAMGWVSKYKVHPNY